MKNLREYKKIMQEQLDMQDEITTILADKLNAAVALIAALEKKIELLESERNFHSIPV